MKLDNLKLLIQKKYNNVSKFGQVAGIPTSTLNDFLNGRSKISYDKFLTILNCLDIRVDNAVLNKLNSSFRGASSVGKDLALVFSQLNKVSRKMIIQTIEKEINLEFANKPNAKVEKAIVNLKSL
jgi:transcriptional regulator with XRE-family HTH domain